MACVIRRHPEAFQWKEPGYEYNFAEYPVDLILGTGHWRTLLDGLRGNPPDWRDQVAHGLAESHRSATVWWQRLVETHPEVLLYDA